MHCLFDTTQCSSSAGQCIVAAPSLPLEHRSSPHPCGLRRTTLFNTPIPHGQWIPFYQTTLFNTQIRSDRIRQLFSTLRSHMQGGHLFIRHFNTFSHSHSTFYQTAFCVFVSVIVLVCVCVFDGQHFSTLPHRWWIPFHQTTENTRDQTLCTICETESQT